MDDSGEEGRGRAGGGRVLGDSRAAVLLPGDRGKRSEVNSVLFFLVCKNGPPRVSQSTLGKITEKKS